MPPALGVLETPPTGNVTELALNVTVPAFNVTVTSAAPLAGATGVSVTCVCCGESTTPAYDAEGAMKFTVAVVLVYGIGVIGMLGIYTRRTIRSHLMDKEASSYVRTIKREKRRFERATQQSALRNLIQSVHGQGLQRSDSFPRVGASPLRNPRLVSPFLLPLLSTNLHTVGEAKDEEERNEEEKAKCGEEALLTVEVNQERRDSAMCRNVSLPGRLEEMAEIHSRALKLDPVDCRGEDVRFDSDKEETETTFAER